MGLLEKIFPSRARNEAVSGYFKALTAYSPVFTSRPGGLYEADRTRSAIHAFASHASKLKPEVTGSARATLAKRLEFQPNPWMDTTKFLYRVATILECTTSAFIVPITDASGRVVEGFYPILPTRSEIVEYQGQLWLVYNFASGQKAAVEFDRVGIVTKFQFKDDFFGDGNGALSTTLDLIDVQRQGLESAVKSSAAIRFLARLGQTIRPDDMVKERERFTKDNLSMENDSGVMMVDAKYADIQQLQHKPYLIDADQMKLIDENVYSYFGCNQAILQNSYDEDGWNAYYEGKIEVFALQLSLVMSNMVFTERERALGNAIMFSSNRLQYASNSTKISVVTQLVDRGLMTDHDACDVFNLPRPEGDPRRVIRGEYIDVENLPDHTLDKARSYLKPAAEPDPDDKE